MEPAELVELLRQSPLARRLAGGGAAGLGTRLGKGALGIAAAALLARLLPPSSFGVFLLGQTVAVFGSLVAVLGLENTLVREVASLLSQGAKAAVRATLRRARALVLVGTGAVATVLVVGRGAALRWLFDAPDLAAMAGWLAVWVGLEALNRVQVSALRGEHRLAVAATLDGFLRAAVFLGALAAMAFLGSIGLVSVFIAAALSSGVSAAVGWWLLSGPAERGEAPTEAEGDCGAEPSIGSLWHRSWPLLGATTLGFLGTQGDLWLVGIVGSTEGAALYGSVLKLLFLASLPLLVLNRTLNSTMAEFHAREQTGDLEVLLRGMTTVVAGASGLVILVLVLFGEQVLTLVFGDFYGAATPVLAILAVGHLLLAATGPCGTMLMMAGHERLKLAVSVASGSYLVLGSLWAGSRWGVVGVAAVSASNKALNNLATLFLVRWRVGVWSHVYLSPLRARDGLIRMVRVARSYAK